MARITDFSFGAFELIYENYLEATGNRQRWRRTEPPLIEPFILPGASFIYAFVTETYYPEASPSWQKAGQLVQYLEPPFAPIAAFNGTGLPIFWSYTPLNRRKLHWVEPCAHEFKLAFEPVPWLPKFSIRVWRWTGLPRDDVLEQLNSMEFDLEIIKDGSPP